MLESRSPDLLLLDWMLPEVDSLELCRFVRRHSDVPIIVLAAKTMVDDKLEGLEAGADDSVTKPFSPREVVARGQAQLRRSARRTRLRCLDLEVDPLRREVQCGGAPLSLTPTELKLLEALLRVPDQALSRSDLASVTQSWDHSTDLRAIDGHFKNLRRKLQALQARVPRIETVFGFGYKLSEGEPCSWGEEPLRGSALHAMTGRSLSEEAAHSDPWLVECLSCRFPTSPVWRSS